MKTIGYILLKIIAILLVINGAIFLIGVFIGYTRDGDIEAAATRLGVSVISFVIGTFISKLAISLRGAKEAAYYPPANRYRRDFPQKWIEVFLLIDKAGGAKLPHLKDLDKKEIFRIRMNWWAFFFGPFYYLALGMWRPMISYLFFMILFFITLDFVALTYFGKDNIKISGVAAGFFWSMLANVNYYKKKVLYEKNWV